MFDAPQTLLSDTSLERALIAMIFADNAKIEAIGDLKPEDLTDPVMAGALAAALNLHADTRPINIVTMKPRLEGMRLGNDVTGLDVVRSLTIGTTPAPFVDIALRLRSLAVKRRLSDYLAAVSRSIVDESQPLPALLADTMQQLNDHLAESIADTKTNFEMYSASHEFIEWLQSDDDPVEITTGLKDLDTATGGWHRGQFAILAARPSMGKSLVALSSALRTAANGHGVLFFSLEMTEKQLVARALTDYAYASNMPLAYSDLKPKQGEYQIRRLKDAAEQFKNLPLDVETKNGLTVGDMMVRAKGAAEAFAKKGTPLALIIIDHLLKVRPSRRYAGQPVKELDEISEAMCIMAKSLNVAVLGLHQLNRGSENRENPRPVMVDLRGTGALEQDADVILFPYRPAYQFERQMQDNPTEKEAAEIKLNAVKNKLEVQIAKQRQGATTTLEFFVDTKANVVRDKAWGRR